VDKRHRSRGAHCVRVFGNHHAIAKNLPPPRMIPKSGVRFSDRDHAQKRGSEAPKGASNHGRPLLSSLPPTGPRLSRARLHNSGGGLGGGSAARLAMTRSPSGAPWRRLPERANAPAQPRPRFTRTRGYGRYPHRYSRLSEAPRASVIVPRGTMPGPPGSGLRNRPQEPHSLHFLDRI